MDMEKVKGLIQQAAQYLSEAELTEENGWTEEDIKTLEFISNNDFDIQFKTKDEK